MKPGGLFVTDNNQKTLTRTLTGKRELQKALRQADLTREEELVLRMRLGIDEPHSTKLEFMGANNPQVMAKLAVIESEALAAMRPRPVANDEGAALKSAIIDQLKEL